VPDLEAGVFGQLVEVDWQGRKMAKEGDRWDCQRWNLDSPLSP
jgi:hypothetical protein